MFFITVIYLDFNEALNMGPPITPLQPKGEMDWTGALQGE